MWPYNIVSSLSETVGSFMLHKSLMGNRLHETEGRENLTPSGTASGKPQRILWFLLKKAREEGIFSVK